MDISGYVKAILAHPMEPIDGREVLDVLYEHYNSERRRDNEDIRSAYARLYEEINHKPIKEVTLMEWPLNELVTLFEIRGFQEGVKVGILLAEELNIAKSVNNKASQDNLSL